MFFHSFLLLLTTFVIPLYGNSEPCYHVGYLESLMGCVLVVYRIKMENLKAGKIFEMLIGFGTVYTLVIAMLIGMSFCTDAAFIGL